MKFELEGEEMLKRTVSKGDSSSRVYVPKGWEGREVAVILLGEE